MINPQTAPKNSSLKKVKKSSVIIPISIFFSLIFIYACTSYFARFKPVIDYIDPEISIPGGTIEINGKYFGTAPDNSIIDKTSVKPIESSVYIADNKLVLSDYLSWNDKKIVLRVPQNVTSGSIFVRTKNGKSNEQVFINRQEIPIVVSSVAEPGQPYISKIDPINGSVGDVITISGVNFGISKGNSNVCFTISSAEKSSSTESVGEFITASDRNYDYINWTDNEIQVRVPDGVSSGKIWIASNGYNSNSFNFERIDNVGSKSFGAKKEYKLEYNISFFVDTVEDENSVQLWVPKINMSSNQRNIKYKKNIEPDLENYSNMMLYRFFNLKNSETRDINLEVQLTRYEVSTKVNRSKAAWNYAKGSQFYREYTNNLYNLNLNDPRLNDIFRRVRKDLDPYSTAESIYAVTKEMTYSAAPIGTDEIDNFIRKAGDSYTYAMIFTALARKAAIPARPVAGFLIYNKTEAVKHFWAEFYIRGLGWVPVDAALGDGARFGDVPYSQNPSEYYFGNTDNQHIAFSEGIIYVPVLSPASKRIFKEKMYSLQTAYEEIIGNFTNYNSFWGGIKVKE